MKKLLLCLAFVVTWKAVIHDPKPCVDEYTGETIANTFSNVCYAWDEVKKPMSKRFEKLSDAYAFMDACPEGTCSDWKIEEKK